MTTETTMPETTTCGRDHRYNGWTNYETWAVALWLDNDPGTYHEAVSAVRADRGNEYAAGKALRELVDELPDVARCREEASLAADLLGAALSECDWQEIAAHYIEDLDEDEDSDDE